MELTEKQSIASTFVPKQCPFCFASDEVVWTEFKVSFGEVHYVDKGTVNERIIDEDVRVVCTRCDEEVLDEDR